MNLIRNTILLLLLFSGKLCYAQIQDSVQQTKDDTVFDVVDHMPEYIGGQEKMIEDLNKSITYPAGDITGTVVVQFVVDTAGDVTQVEVLKGVHEILDSEAMRAVSGLGKFTPGMINGKPVRVRLRLPISFR